MSQYKDQEDRFFASFSDILSILRRSQKKILYFALTFGMLGVLLALIQPIRYQAEATFRERGIKQSSLSSSSSILQLLSSGNGMGGTESEAKSLMMSRTILKDVIEKLHLQADLQACEDLESLPRLAKHNLILTWASLKNSSKPLLKDPQCPITIESLTYTGELPLSLKIELDREGHYQVYDALSKQFIGKGELNKPFRFETLSFTLSPAHPNPIPEQSFRLVVNSLTNTTKKLCQALKIEPAKLDKNFLNIKFEHRNRHLASKIVNALIESYQSYLQNYHSNIALQQLDYLSKRRDQLTQNLMHLMQKHANFLAMIYTAQDSLNLIKKWIF